MQKGPQSDPKIDKLFDYSTEIVLREVSADTQISLELLRSFADLELSPLDPSNSNKPSEHNPFANDLDWTDSSTLTYESPSNQFAQLFANYVPPKAPMATDDEELEEEEEEEKEKEKEKEEEKKNPDEFSFQGFDSNFTTFNGLDCSSQSKEPKKIARRRTRRL